MAETIHTQAIVDFYNGMEVDDIASKKAGRPIYNDQEMVRIRWVGNTKSELHAPASDRSDRPIVNRADRSRTWPSWKDHPDFADAYKAFKSGQANAVSGTPLSELPFLSEAKRAELRAVNILSAEQLVKLEATSKLGMDFAFIKEQTAAFLKRAAGAAVDAAHAADKAEMQKQIDDLRALVEGKAAPAAPVAKAKVAAKPEAASTSPFASWEPADILNWMKDADPTAPVPHHKTGQAKLCELADAIQAKLAEQAGNRQPVAA